MPKANEDESPVLALDLGGTKILAAIISGSGQMIAGERCPTQADEGPHAVIARMLVLVDNILDENNITRAQLDSISIASAGIIDSEKGLVTVSPNLPGWHDVPIRGIVEERCGVRSFLVNDASAAALGEHDFGAGRGTRNMIYVTVSTGIGAGIIINGDLYTGSSGSAGEIGHMTIDYNGPECNCGSTGCLEALASGTAMASEAKKRIEQGEQSSLMEMVTGNIEDITAEKIGIAARNGDSLALGVIARAAYWLGVGLANLVNIFNPDLIVVGGGVSKLGDLLLAPAERVVKERAFRVSADAVRIVPAQLGGEAEVFGAAAFALRHRK